VSQIQIHIFSNLFILKTISFFIPQPISFQDTFYCLAGSSFWLVINHTTESIEDLWAAKYAGETTGDCGGVLDILAKKLYPHIKL